MKLGKILKYCFIAMMIVFASFLAVRIFMTSDRSALNDVFPTADAKAAYSTDGDSAFLTNSFPNDMSEDGYFTAYALSYAKSTKELQVTVRYNESLSEKYLIGSDPEKYYFELRDKDGNTVSKARIVDEKERYFYQHLRLAFSDIEKDEELYLFLICDECQYPAKHTKGLLLVHPSLEFKPLKLSSNEIKKLKND